MLRLLPIVVLLGPLAFGKEKPGKGDPKPAPQLIAAVKSGDVAAVGQALQNGASASAVAADPETIWQGEPVKSQPIHYAAAGGHVEIVRLLLERGAKADATNSAGQSPLHLARNAEIAELLLAQGTDLNRVDLLGQLPLHMAAGHAEHGVVEFLVSRGAKVDAPVEPKADDFQRGWRPLHFAAQREDEAEAVAIVGLLIKQSAKPAACGVLGDQALHGAATPGVAKLLIDHGAPVNAALIDGSQPLHTAVRDERAAVVRLLLDRGADAKALTKAGESPVEAAAMMGDITVLERLLARGGQATQPALIQAVLSGKLATVKLLLQRGGILTSEVLVSANAEMLRDLLPIADAGLIARCGPELMFKAAEAGDLELVKTLQQRGVRLDAVVAGSRLIHVAAFSERAELVRYLLDAGAQVSIPNTDGFTPLHLAAISGHLPTIDLLLGRGAQVNEKAMPNSEQAIHLAAAYGRVEVIPYLMQKGSKIDALANDGSQPLHSAASMGQIHAVQALLKAGASAKAVTKDGATPLMLAQKGNYPDGDYRLVIDLLKKSSPKK